MQTEMILHSNYITSSQSVGRIANAEREGLGWIIKVSESLAHHPENALVWEVEENNTLYFTDNEVEVVESPFACWNALKSSREIGGLAHD